MSLLAPASPCRLDPAAREARNWGLGEHDLRYRDRHGDRETPRHRGADGEFVDGVRWSPDPDAAWFTPPGWAERLDLNSLTTTNRA